MKRGDIYFARLDPTQGAEIQKTRPVVIVSNDIANRVSNLVTVIPLSSNVTRIFPFEVEMSATESGLPKDSKALAQQVRTLDKSRLNAQRSGFVNATVLLKIDTALKLHLALN